MGLGAGAAGGRGRVPACGPAAQSACAQGGTYTALKAPTRSTPQDNMWWPEVARVFKGAQPLAPASKYFGIRSTRHVWVWPAPGPRLACWALETDRWSLGKGRWDRLKHRGARSPAFASPTPWVQCLGSSASSNTPRRYEGMDLPDGLAFVGDSNTSFNPVYGQVG